MIAKVGCCLLGLSAISVGGVALTNPEWVGIKTSIKWKPLSLDNGFAGKTAQGQEYHSKFGSTYKNYLTGLGEANKGWWNDRFNRIGTKPIAGRFKNVDAGYEGTNSLKSRCEEAYKKSETDLKTEGGSLQDADFLQEEVWKYCSYVEAEPKTIDKSGEESDYSSSDSTNKIGKDKKTDLLSIKSGNNTKLWELKNDEFFGTGAFETANKKTTLSEKFFEELLKLGNKNKDDLKNKCLAAYKLVSSDSPNENQPKADDVVKYCSTKSIK